MRTLPPQFHEARAAPGVRTLRHGQFERRHFPVRDWPSGNRIRRNDVLEKVSPVPDGEVSGVSETVDAASIEVSGC